MTFFLELENTLEFVPLKAIFKARSDCGQSETPAEHLGGECGSPSTLYRGQSLPLLLLSYRIFVQSFLLVLPTYSLTSSPWSSPQLPALSFRRSLDAFIMGECFAWMHVCTSCACSTCRNQKRVLDSLKLELDSCQPLCRPIEPNSGCLPEQPVLLTAGHSPPSSSYFCRLFTPLQGKPSEPRTPFVNCRLCKPSRQVCIPFSSPPTPLPGAED